MTKTKATLILATMVVTCSGTAVQSAKAAPPATKPDAEVALAKLKEGNVRYVSGQSTVLRIDPARRELTATSGQHPVATILGCADARVPPEIVFDQKFANLFVIRVAGNVTGISEVASAEYGVHYLGTPLVVVLGHSACGAVKAAVDKTPLEGKLPKLVQMISPAVENAHAANPKLTGDAFTEAAVEENVRYQMSTLLKQSDLIRKANSAGKIKVVGAIRDIMTGKIRWL